MIGAGTQHEENPMNKILKLCPLALLTMATLLLSALGPVEAQTDKEMALKARELQHGDNEDHSQHSAFANNKGSFRGVYYGYLPCNEVDCKGIKMTLSLNATNNYLLVIQPARLKNRETFEKGRYDWDEVNGRVTLFPNKESPKRILSIQGDGNLVVLTEEGTPHTGSQDPYVLKRSDSAGNREMHIH